MQRCIAAELALSKSTKLVQLQTMEVEAARADTKAERARASRMVGQLLKRDRKHRSCDDNSKAQPFLKEQKVLKEKNSRLVKSLEETEDQLVKEREKADQAWGLAMHNRTLHRPQIQLSVTTHSAYHKQTDLYSMTCCSSLQSNL